MDRWNNILERIEKRPTRDAFDKFMFNVGVYVFPTAILYKQFWWYEWMDPDMRYRLAFWVVMVLFWGFFTFVLVLRIRRQILRRHRKRSDKKKLGACIRCGEKFTFKRKKFICVKCYLAEHNSES